MPASLASRHCVPCRGDTPALSRAAAEGLLASLDPAWRIDTAGRLAREYRVVDFAAALALANRIGAIADAEDHHPDLTVAWGRLDVTLRTHVIDGLTENDFILAAKIDTLKG